MIHDIEIKEIVLYGLRADARETMAEELRSAIVERIASGLTATDAGTERNVIDAGSFSITGNSKRELARSFARALSSAVFPHHTTTTPGAGSERDQHQSSLVSDHYSNAGSDNGMK